MQAFIERTEISERFSKTKVHIKIFVRSEKFLQARAKTYPGDQRVLFFVQARSSRNHLQKNVHAMNLHNDSIGSQNILFARILSTCRQREIKPSNTLCAVVGVVLVPVLFVLQWCRSSCSDSLLGSEA